MKLCRVCEQPGQFRKNSRVCKSCEYERAKARRAAIDPAVLAWRDKTTQVKMNYGVTPEQFNEQWENQGKCCAICGQDDLANYDIVLDHSHETNEFRGILCRWCNVIIGKARESQEILLAAARYLTEDGTGIICDGKATR